MSKKFAALGALAGVIATGTAASTAQAGLVVPLQSQGFGIGSEPVIGFAGEGREDFMSMGSSSTPLTFDLFDPAAGTLTGVTISVNFGGGNDVFISSTSTSEIFTGDGVEATSSAFLTFGTAGEQFLQFSSDVSANCSPAIGGGCVADESDVFDGQDSQSSFLLSDFTGAGQFDIDVDIKVTIEGEVTGFLSGSAQGAAFVEGTVDVQYDYIPSDIEIAEPASLTLLGLGLSGLGLARRRRVYS